ncbi:MAG: CSLREA domain-containing protein [Chloroflexota bacterium]
MNRKAPLLSVIVVVALIAAGLLGLAFPITSVRANTIVVNTTADDLVVNGNCTLREAIIAANSDTAVDDCAAGSGHDVITLPPGIYTLTLAGAGEDGAQTGDLDLTADVTINGGGIANFGTLLLVNSTLSGNNAGGSGGGLSTIEGLTTQLYNATISGNTADAQPRLAGRQPGH